MAKPDTIFFSWQSDLRAASCRTLIEDALRAAVAEIVDGSLLAVEPAVDRDTQGMPGSPNIGTRCSRRSSVRACSSPT
jgi:hypothetical protein